MNETKSKLRSLLDFLEGAGLTITYYNEEEKKFSNTSTSITMKHGDTGQRKTSEIAALFENNAYHILQINEESKGTISVQIISINS
jgi:hypothetical protein